VLFVRLLSSSSFFFFFFLLVFSSYFFLSFFFLSNPKFSGLPRRYGKMLRVCLKQGLLYHK